MKHLPTVLGRREFLKTKIFFTLYAYLSQFIDLKPTKPTIKAKLYDYTILDKLLELPFSSIVKKEVAFRVELQKRYCTDSNGCLQPLDRFLKEIVYFIIYYKDERDFKLLKRLQNRQIDYNYLVKTLVRLDRAKDLNDVQDKLVSADDSFLRELLYDAIRSKAYDCTKHLLGLNIPLDKKTKSTLQTIISTKDYKSFYEQLTKSIKADILPSLLEYKPTKKREVKKLANHIYPFTYNDYIESLYIIVHNSICELYLNELIDDYSLSISSGNVYLSVWNYKNCYRVDFMKIFESYLIENGFNSVGSELKEYISSRYEKIIDERYELESDPHIKNIDYYEFIVLEVL